MPLLVTHHTSLVTAPGKLPPSRCRLRMTPVQSGEVKVMAAETITIQVDGEAARALQSRAAGRPKEDGSAPEPLVDGRGHSRARSLERNDDDLSTKARRRGLTPEILQSLLKKRSLRFVFDTNALISAALCDDSTSRRAFDHAMDRGTILLSLPA